MPDTKQLLCSVICNVGQDPRQESNEGGGRHQFESLAWPLPQSVLMTANENIQEESQQGKETRVVTSRFLHTCHHERVKMPHLPLLGSPSVNKIRDKIQVL